MPNGRPTAYTPELAEEIVKRTMMGEWAATDEQIADLFGVSRETVRRWRRKDPNLDAAIRRARLMADNRVESVLFHQACSGDVHACITWLRNRRPNEWREKKELDIRTQEGTQVNYSVEEIERLANLPQEDKLELARTARAHHAVLVRLNLKAQESIDAEAEEDSEQETDSEAT